MLTPLCCKVYFFTPWRGQCDKHQWLREQTVRDILLYSVIFFAISQLKQRIKDLVILSDYFLLLTHIQLQWLEEIFFHATTASSV
jgi:hypothetical protein